MNDLSNNKLVGNVFIIFTTFLLFSLILINKNISTGANGTLLENFAPVVIISVVIALSFIFTLFVKDLKIPNFIFLWGTSSTLLFYFISKIISLGFFSSDKFRWILIILFTFFTILQIQKSKINNN